MKRYIPHDIRCMLQRAKNGRGLLSPAMPQDEGEQSAEGFYKTRSIFVHIPKAAGISIKHGLYGNKGMGHQKIRNYQLEFFKKDFDSFYKFTFVRNPWDRLFSAYNFLKAGGINDNDARWTAENLSEINSFEDFAINWMGHDKLHSIVHLTPQEEFLRSFDGSYPIDYIGHYETIEDDYEFVRKQIGHGEPLEHRNKTNVQSQSYKDVYSPEMIEKVRDLYAADIELLKYEF